MVSSADSYVEDGSDNVGTEHGSDNGRERSVEPETAQQGDQKVPDKGYQGEWNYGCNGK
ncbi:hypothetical protein D3C80_2063560 [compost metagenome]